MNEGYTLLVFLHEQLITQFDVASYLSMEL